MNMKRLLTALSVWIAALPTAWAQICETDTSLQTAPAANFVTSNPDPNRYPVTLADDGSEVLDLSTGLVWARCSLGQSWDATQQRCLGVPLKLTWKEALAEAKTQAEASGKAWRLPNIKELASIIEFQCQTPPFNLAVFPDTPASVPAAANDNLNSGFGSGYWSASPLVSIEQYNTPEFRYAWYLDTHVGEARWKPVTSGLTGVVHVRNFARLVRHQ